MADRHSLFLSFSLFFALYGGILATNDCSADTPEPGKFVICAHQIKTVVVGDNTSLYLYTEFGHNTNVSSISLNVSIKHGGVVEPFQDIITLDVPGNATLILHAIGAGRTEVSFNYSNNEDYINKSIEKLDHLVREASVVHWKPLNIIIAIIGWLYFAAWSISFYPQIFLNFYRRSVVGLNFDFLAYNITGFLAYSAFNIGLYWIPVIENEYFDRNPGGVNPVQLNDVIFAVHAAAATLFTIFQCIIFERNKQRISIVGGIILTILWSFMIISLFVSVGHKLEWLDFLYFVSYVKLAVTLIKYVPQAYMNFRRKSTVGWSIGNVLLDFTGGTLSILQMFLISYNYDDWKSIFGDPTKFGLGAFSICFDLLFMTQHYILYRHPPASKEGYTKIDFKRNSMDPETRPLLGDESDDFTPSFFTKVKVQVGLLLVKLKLRSSVADVAQYSP